MLTYIKNLKLITDFIHTLQKKINTLSSRFFKILSMISVKERKCVFHHDDFVYLQILKFLMIFY